eukprot:3128194-Lingulodinium_polyedra.AAC.1
MSGEPDTLSGSETRSGWKGAQLARTASVSYTEWPLSIADSDASSPGAPASGCCLAAASQMRATTWRCEGVA